MKKVQKIKAALVALGAVGLITVVSVASSVEKKKEPVEKIIEVESCSEVELKVGKDHLCMTEDDYKTIKKNLHKEYKNKTKNYDFDINNREIFMAILSKEVKEKKVSFDKLMDKEYLMEELFNTN